MCTAARCNALQHTATRCITLQHTATCCQHTASRLSALSNRLIPCPFSVCVHAYILIHFYLHLHMPVKCIYYNMYILNPVNLSRCLVYVHSFIHTCIHIYTHTYIRTHICAHMHVNMHAHSALLNHMKLCCFFF